MAHRRPIVAGNWKMHLDRTAARALATAIAARGTGLPSVDLVVCPPAVYLDAVADTLRVAPVSLGAQNAWDKPSGAFTGEVAPQMLADVGCRFVILGHSERRSLCGETDAVVNAKIKAALGAGLTPIVCVGETLAEREAGRTDAVVAAQVRGSLAGLPAADVARLVIAYEPVWAIGTGKVATPAQAQAVHALIRRELAALAGADTAAGVRIQYGGSVKPDNAADLAAQADIDGALVGGASLDADGFLAIAAAFAR
ncbi:MAG: triose-phosphate isomerase [Planctomycetaceae bacterium]